MRSQHDPVALAETATTPDGSTFKVAYLDVGQADAAVIQCDGHNMMIDGGNVPDSDLVYSYLKQEGIDHLDYMIGTHAHEDHIGGLSGALNEAIVDHVYCSATNDDSEFFFNFKRYVEIQGKKIEVPTAGETFPLGSATITILGPRRTYTDTNDNSIICRIVYGNTSFLFTGDATETAERDILDSGYSLHSTVLKIGHHGSSTSTCYRFLRAVEPLYAVISVGADNSYGHPAEATLSRLRDADAQVYRTDLQGTITCSSDGNSVTFYTTR